MEYVYCNDKWNKQKDNCVTKEKISIIPKECEWEHIRQIQKKFEEVKEIEGKEGNYMACDKALEDARYYSKIGGKKKVKSKEKLKMSKT